MKIKIEIENEDPEICNALLRKYCRETLADTLRGIPDAQAEPTPPAPPAGDAPSKPMALLAASEIRHDFANTPGAGDSWVERRTKILADYVLATVRDEAPPPVAAPDAERMAKLEEVAVKAEDLRTAIGLSNLDDLSREDTHKIRRKFSHLVTALEALDDPAN
jgi:hypothetical protein